MTAARAVWIVCDECDAQTPSDLSCSTAPEARRWARSAGWKRIGGKDICDECIVERDGTAAEALAAYFGAGGS